MGRGRGGKQFSLSLHDFVVFVIVVVVAGLPY